MGNGIRIRSAEASDEAAVVPLMHAAAAAANDACFGFPDHDAKEFLRADFRRGDGIFGWRHQFVATSASGSIVATATLYGAHDVGSLTFATTASAFAHYSFNHVAAVAIRSARAMGLFAPMRNDGAYLANVCVEPSSRGRGVFSEMAGFVDDWTLREGLKCVQLDVALQNPRAQSLYERLGYTVVAQSEPRAAHGFDGMRRMVKELRLGTPAPRNTVAPGPAQRPR